MPSNRRHKRRRWPGWVRGASGIPDRAADPGLRADLTGGEGVPLFFVCGLPKSGTSWLMNLLNSHPRILCRGEGRFFGLSHEIGGASARALQQTLRDSEPLREWSARSAWTRRSEPSEVADLLTASFVRAVMTGALAGTGKLAVGDKSPISGGPAISEIGRLLPGARVIHIVRDGRDVAVSAAHHVWNYADRGREIHPGDAAIRDAYRADPEGFVRSGRSLFREGGLETAARAWAEGTIAARRQGEALPSGHYAEVRYEDLLTQGAGELVRLCRVIGVECTPEEAERCMVENAFERVSGRPPGVERSSEFLRSGVAGDWRRVLGDAEASAYGRLAAEALEAFGYEGAGRAGSAGLS